jgi:hypothetical protein
MQKVGTGARKHPNIGAKNNTPACSVTVSDSPVQCVDHRLTKRWFSAVASFLPGSRDCDCVCIEAIDNNVHTVRQLVRLSHANTVTHHDAAALGGFLHSWFGTQAQGKFPCGSQTWKGVWNWPGPTQSETGSTGLCNSKTGLSYMVSRQGHLPHTLPQTTPHHSVTIHSMSKDIKLKATILAIEEKRSIQVLSRCETANASMSESVRLQLLVPRLEPAQLILGTGWDDTGNPDVPFHWHEHGTETPPKCSWQR